VCNVDVIKTKPETVWYFAYWRARDVPSGAEVAIGPSWLPSARASVQQRLCGSAHTAAQTPWHWRNSVK